MKAIRVSHTGDPSVMEVVDVQIPRAKSGEAGVKVHVAGVNSIDAQFRDGRLRTPLPFIPGQEGAGVVTAVGPQAKMIRVGDRVAWSGTLGSYAEYVAVAEEHLVPVPASITDEQAAAVMVHGLTAHYLVHDAHKLKPGETALVHAAAGAVGLLLVQMARAAGARVIGTASSAEKARLAREAGADEVIVFTQQDFEPEVKRLTGGKGVDVVYDGVGKATFEKNLNVMRLRGMLVLYGMSSGAVPPVDPAKLSEKGSLYMARTTLAHFTATREELLARTHDLFGMITDGKLKVRIAKTYSLAEAAQAHRDLEARQLSGKLLLMME
ncbi:MAG TPA: quinone oxidoreductase [Candidatus Sulfotelmatobacter sp.]|nr:quinone oxidoreductase [Candidatus Sulfotelmatobacter sp.]HEV2469066.1 quinone oxidoreductase [Candidatus Sulfotelmatobacter sp.]